MMHNVMVDAPEISLKPKASSFSVFITFTKKNSTGFAYTTYI